MVLPLLERKPGFLDYARPLVDLNLPFKEWTEVFGSEALTGALLYRIIHKCHILEAHGDSYRLRQAKEKGAEIALYE